MLHLQPKWYAMKKRISIIACLLALVLLFGSCASSRSRALRRAEKQLEQQEKQSKKQYDKAKTAHYKHQAKKTKRMIQKDKRRAERMRRRKRSNPFFSSWNARFYGIEAKKCDWSGKNSYWNVFLQMIENQKNIQSERKFAEKKYKKQIFFLRTFK